MSIGFLSASQLKEVSLRIRSQALGARLEHQAYTRNQINFEQEIVRLQDTLVVMAEIQRRQAEVQKIQAEGWALHEQRMAHVDLRLAEITAKLDGLIGFTNGQFGKQ